MKIEVYLFPESVSLASCSVSSKELFKFLEEEGIELEEKRWDGTLDFVKSIQSDNQVMIRSSSMAHCSDLNLGPLCHNRNFFLFYDDFFIGIEGKLEGKIVEKAKKFIKE